MSVTYLDTTDAVLHQQQRDGKKGARVMRIVLCMQPREGTSVQDLVNAVAAKLTPWQAGLWFRFRCSRCRMGSIFEARVRPTATRV